MDRFIVLIFLLTLFLNNQPIYAAAEHVQVLDQLIITSTSAKSTANTAMPVSILSEDALRMKAASTIGETLKNEPGITNQSFGPGVGQPVIRGQSGPRVQVLQNGLGSLDVSSLSPDHANSTEALLARQIEVLRGPATLLYGSGAMGGIVNVIDDRIPDSIPEQLLQGAVEQRYNTVNEGKSTVFKLDGGKDMLAWHLDGFYRDSINMQIPGNAFLGSTSTGSQGRLENTNTRARSGSAGFSVVGERGFIGFSGNRLDNNYGVPPGQDPATVRINLRQNRYDMKAEVNDPVEFADKLRIRLGYNDYQHTELENGIPGTVFKNKGFVSRLELTQKPWAIFDHGVLGVQTKNNEFSAIGEESLVPQSQINDFSFFTVQDIHTEMMTYEMGLRVEQQWIDPIDRPEISHTPFSFSASALWSVTEDDAIKLTFTRSQRAPDVQELLAFGAHPATGTFEIGNANLKEETSHNLELGIHIDHEWLQANFNFFQNWVQDYVSEINNGRFFNSDSNSMESRCSTNACLPVFETQQRNAEFQGFEAQITLPLLETEMGQLESQLFGDYVRGRFSNGGDIPRMPPLRYGLQLAWQNYNWEARVRLTRAEDQNKPGENETVTPGYWLLTAAANYHLDYAENKDMLLFVKGHNLLNQDIRNSVSFLRNVSPEAARGVELGIRLVF